MKNFMILLCLPVLFLVSTCNGIEPEVEDPLYHSETAKNYLNELMDIMQNNSINKHRIDWPEFRKEVLRTADGAETIEDTYPGVEKALELLEDNHSFYIKPDGGGISATTFVCDQENITETSWPDHIGYVKVNSFSGGASDGPAIKFAEDIQRQISDQDNEQLAGWIVDLRGNLGGNMWPMLAGIGPLLGEGTAGYFIDADNNRSPWGYSNGAAVANNTEVITELPTPYPTLGNSPKVAVLLSNSIASSGEAIAVSFIGRPNTRSFGTATCGLSTSNRYFRLSDGAALLLTNAYFADRDRNIFGRSLEPDETVDDETIIQAATNWIMN